MRLNKLRQFNINGTTSVTANQPMLAKPRNRWLTSGVFPFGFCGEGLYFESLDRKGSNFDVAEVTFEAGATTEIKVVRLTSSIYIVAYADGGDSGKGKIAAFSRVGVTPTQGAVTTFEAGATTGIDLVYLDSTHVAVSFIDGSDTFVKVVVCSIVQATLVITAGTASTASAAANDTGTAICSPRSGVLTVAYTLTSDGLGYVDSATYSVITVGTWYGPTNFEAGATKYPSLCVPGVGDFLVVYQDDGAVNDPITYNAGAVAADAVTVVLGAATSLAGTAAAATLISVKKAPDGVIVAGWVDSGKGHLRAATFSDYALTAGTELEITAATNTPGSLSFDFLGSTEGVIAFDNDDFSDYGMVKLFTRSGTTLTAGNQDVFAEATTAGVGMVALEDNMFAVCFNDSDPGKTMIGSVENHLIDIRSTVASAKFDGYMLHKNKAGLGLFNCYRISGTTHASADTAMSTLVTLPFNKWSDVIVLFKDKGMYVEDDGTLAPLKLGVSRSGRTIDVRSTSTSVAFVAYVIRCSGAVRWKAM